MNPLCETSAGAAPSQWVTVVVCPLLSVATLVKIRNSFPVLYHSGIQFPPFASRGTVHAA